MKFKLNIIAAVAAAVALTSTVQAVPITGNIGFSGVATLNSGSAGTATQVTTWGTNNVFSVSAGSALALFVTLGDQVTLHSPWTFNSPAINSFWTVDGFTFNLSNSSIFSNSGGFLAVVLAGTVVGHGYDATAFTGSFQLADPSADGQTQFTTRLSFTPVPDGGSTVLLLGAALSGLALIKRKLVA